MNLVWILDKRDDVAIIARAEPVPLRAERYLFCQGLLRPERIGDQSEEEIAESFLVNAAQIIRECDTIFAENENARVCVIGSESGFSWSHDGSYAAAKAALHQYVETKKLTKPGQQLICIAPGMIGDAGMTARRKDQENVNLRCASHPKGRLLTSVEVARMIYHSLYVDEGYLSGIVIRMNGGAHTCRE
jgi:NAD(P)-dependent dehydrogenase (short-subunit alcohol dehydrogenase family)